MRIGKIGAYAKIKDLCVKHSGINEYMRPEIHLEGPYIISKIGLSNIEV